MCRDRRHRRPVSRCDRQPAPAQRNGVRSGLLRALHAERALAIDLGCGQRRVDRGGMARRRVHEAHSHPTAARDLRDPARRRNAGRRAGVGEDHGIPNFQYLRADDLARYGEARRATDVQRAPDDRRRQRDGSAHAGRRASPATAVGDRRAQWSVSRCRTSPSASPPRRRLRSSKKGCV